MKLWSIHTSIESKNPWYMRVYVYAYIMHYSHTCKHATSVSAYICLFEFGTYTLMYIYIHTQTNKYIMRAYVCVYTYTLSPSLTHSRTQNLTPYIYIYIYIYTRKLSAHMNG